MVKITSDVQFMEIMDGEIKRVREVTKAREKLLESMQSGFEKSDRPFDPKYLILLVRGMNDMLGGISIFTYLISKALLLLDTKTKPSETKPSDRDQNIELLNALVTTILDKTEEYDKAVSKINEYFKDLESLR